MESPTLSDLSGAMSNRTQTIGIAVVALILVGAAVSYPAWNVRRQRPSQVNATVSSAVAPSDPKVVPTSPAVTATDASAKKGTVYDTADLTLTVPAGWTAKQAATTAGVNVTNGKWILYINVNASQASGVEGGRFAEIAMGAPSADAVVTDWPGECGTRETTPAHDSFSRVDNFVGPDDARAGCSVPTNGKTVWFFSYLTSPGNGYFNDYVPGQNPALVVTMAYDGKVVNDFPVKGSAELTKALAAMTDIASTLKIKNR